MQYKFKAFGLNIISDFPFQASKIDEKGFFDVTIKSGSVKNHLENSTFKGVSFESNLKQFLLIIPNVAKFLIEEGNKITIDTDKTAELREIELFLLGSALSVILMQRSIVPFHGSAFEKDGKAVIITGNSGAGKSSLLRYFINKGYKALSDDVCALNEQDNKIVLTPSYPSSKIWADVLDIYNISKEEEKQVRPDIEKYKINFEEDFSEKITEVEAIYILQSNNDIDFSIDEIKGFNKFTKLKQNLYRPKFPEAMGKEKETFIILNKLAQQIKLYNLFRSKSIKQFMPFNEFAKQNIIG